MLDLAKRYATWQIVTLFGLGGALVVVIYTVVPVDARQPCLATLGAVGTFIALHVNLGGAK